MSWAGLLGGIIGALLVAYALRTQRSAAIARDGWHSLRPGWIHWVMFLGSAALVALAILLSLPGLLTPAEADRERPAALFLLVVFGAAVIYAGWDMFGRTIRWKDDELRVRPLAGREHIRRLSDVV